eukprot:TRINITY_DN11226_c0_g1_i1.p1 TRINITY_DN11226_c0_g1~~TRINITY_DN11226_c0_g1_i1.p1  ORF type:complete len:846 (+),score=204.09 TRINITY_DN11226_c0_g1_i1:84-2540(+)
MGAQLGGIPAAQEEEIDLSAVGALQRRAAHARAAADLGAGWCRVAPASPSHRARKSGAGGQVHVCVFEAGLARAALQTPEHAAGACLVPAAPPPECPLRHGGIVASAQCDADRRRLRRALARAVGPPAQQGGRYGDAASGAAAELCAALCSASAVDGRCDLGALCRAAAARAFARTAAPPGSAEVDALRLPLQLLAGGSGAGGGAAQQRVTSPRISLLSRARGALQQLHGGPVSSPEQRAAEELRRAVWSLADAAAEAAGRCSPAPSASSTSSAPAGGLGPLLQRLLRLTNDSPADSSMASMSPRHYDPFGASPPPSPDHSASRASGRFWPLKLGGSRRSSRASQSPSTSPLPSPRSASPPQPSAATRKLWRRSLPTPVSPEHVSSPARNRLSLPVPLAPLAEQQQQQAEAVLSRAEAVELCCAALAAGAQAAALLAAAALARLGSDEALQQGCRAEVMAAAHAAAVGEVTDSDTEATVPLEPGASFSWERLAARCKAINGLLREELRECPPCPTLCRAVAGGPLPAPAACLSAPGADAARGADAEGATLPVGSRLSVCAASSGLVFGHGERACPCAALAVGVARVLVCRVLAATTLGQCSTGWRSALTVPPRGEGLRIPDGTALIRAVPLPGSERLSALPAPGQFTFGDPVTVRLQLARAGERLGVGVLCDFAERLCIDRVDPGGPCGRAGVGAGVLVSIAGREVETSADVFAATRRAAEEGLTEIDFSYAPLIPGEGETPLDVTQPHCATGDRVRRNPSAWDYGNQDGGEGQLGTIVALPYNGWATVRWDSGGQNEYRCGAGWLREIQVVERPAGH